MEQITARGHVDAFLVSPAGVMKKVVCGKNTLSYLCADAVAKLFAGLVDARPQFIGFVYGPKDKGTSWGFTDGTREQTDNVGTDLAVHDAKIAPNSRFAQTATTDKDGNAVPKTKYTGNTVTLSGMTTDDLSAETYIYGFLLKDGDGNVLATKRLTSAVQKPSGYAMSVSWSVTFS